MNKAREQARHVAWIIGRRGAALIVWALVFGLYGVLLLMSQVPEEPPRTVAVIIALAPIRTWGYAWLAAAGVAFVQALSGRFRGTAWAYASLSFISGIWASGYIAGWIVMEPPRDPRGWLTGLLWLSVFLLTIIMSGWRDHLRPTDEVPSHPGESEEE